MKNKLGKRFCIMPWIHLHSIPDGRVMGCCIWKNDHYLGNVKEQTVEEIANGEPMKSVRSRMLADERLTECDSCNLREEANPNSITHRRFYNHQHKHLIDELVEQTDSDGTIHYDFKLRSMNLRFSNLCNYSCRSCDSKYSSVWAQEQGWSKPVINVIDDSPDYLEQILEHLPYVEYINFTGGESLLTPEHWIILERLIEIGKTDVNIDFYTNVSRLEYKDRSIIDVVKNFNLDKFKVRVSLDATHERAELYRNGTVWSTVERNLRLLRQNDINVVVNSTIGAMNVWHAPDLQRYLIDEGLILNRATGSIVNPWVLTNLIYPEHIRTTVLPQDYKLMVKEKILKHQEYLKQNNYNHQVWDMVIDYMMSRDDQDLLSQFIKFNNDLDNIRNQKTLEVFPELKNIGN